MYEYMKFFNNPLIAHVLAQVYHAEGVRGLYKGTTAVYLRIMPHTVLQLLAVGLPPAAVLLPERHDRHRDRLSPDHCSL